MKSKISVILILVVLLSAFGAFKIEASIDKVPNRESKISDSLKNRLSETVDVSEIIPVYIWLTDIDQNNILIETEKQFGTTEENAINDISLLSDSD